MSTGWLSLTLEVAAADVEALADALLEAGALSVDVADAEAGSDAESPLYDEPGAGGRVWRRSRLTVLLPEAASVPELMAQACARAGLTIAPPEVRRLADQDWVRASREQFVPTRISQRLWVVPSWHAPPDPGAVNIVLDPGLAFGTGTHPTTQLCLRWLERAVRGGETVLDYGCGSGILAIAAMKLGAARAAGIDIDEQALLAARANALQNRAEVTFYSAARAPRQPAQIVVANILAHPLIVLAPALAGYTEPRGRLALAGLLAQQAAEVRAAYERWFEFENGEADEDWVLLSATRRPA